MVQKSDAHFVLIQAYFIHWSKLQISLLSITTKLIILFNKETIVNFSSASIYRSDMRKSGGDEKRKTKIYLLNKNQNCDLMKTVLYPCLRVRVLGVLACSRAWRAYVLTCLACLRACVLVCLTCLACSRACVLTCLVCLYARALLTCFL